MKQFDLQEQARELYISVGDPFRASTRRSGPGHHLPGAVVRWKRHACTIYDGLELARRYGVRYVLGWLYWNQGVMSLGHGDWTCRRVALQAVNARSASNQ